MSRTTCSDALILINALISYTHHTLFKYLTTISLVKHKEIVVFQKTKVHMMFFFGVSTAKLTPKASQKDTQTSKSTPKASSREPKTNESSSLTTPRHATTAAKTSQADKETSTVTVISTTETSMCITSDPTFPSNLKASSKQPKTNPKPNLSTSTTKPTIDKATRLILLVSTAVGVILFGLFSLCWFASKRRKKSNRIGATNPDVSSPGIGMSCSAPREMYSLITSALATSQPIYEDLEHSESHQHNRADPSHTFITSVNPIYQPSDAVANKKQHQKNAEENEDVYHMYCTIPDRPV